MSATDTASAASAWDGSAEPLLAVRDLRVEFSTQAGTITAVDGVSFDVHAGKTLAILGESGSGKSVTAQAIMGILDQPAGRIVGGQIVYRGNDLLLAPPATVRRLRGTEISMVFQDPLSSLNPVLRVGNQIGEMFRRRRGASRKEARDAAIELMRRVGIPAAEQRVDDYPHQFSGGMRQRVMIAIAIALEPALIIADEPTTALDVTVQAQIMDLLKGLQEENGMALVLISHDLGVVADSADRVLMMYAGKPVETGGIREVYDEAAHPYTRGLLGSIPELDHASERLTPIKGSPPDLLALPTGCVFNPRCGFATDICRRDSPPLEQVPRPTPGHLAACHHMREVLARG